MDHMTLCLSTVILLSVNLDTVSPSVDLTTTAVTQVNNFDSYTSSDQPADHTLEESNSPAKSHGTLSSLPTNKQPYSSTETVSIDTISFDYTNLKTDGEITTVTNGISEGASPTANTFATVENFDTGLNGTTDNVDHETDITTWSSDKIVTSTTDDTVGLTQAVSAATQSVIPMDTRPSTEKSKSVSSSTVYTEVSKQFTTTQTHPSYTVYTEVSKQFTTTQTHPSSNFITNISTNTLNTPAAYNVSSGGPLTKETTKPITTSRGSTDLTIDVNSPPALNFATSTQSVRKTTNNSTSTTILTKTEMIQPSTITSNPGLFGGLTSPTKLPDSYVKVAGEDITLQMEISITDNFIVDLKNTSSAKYQKYAQQFKQYLTDLYGNIQGFKSITITGFRNGSIVASYLLELNNVSSIRQAVREVNTTVRNGIHDTSIANKYNLKIEMTETLALLDATLHEVKDICHLYKQPCPFGYQCSSSNSFMYTCDSKCSRKYNPCGANGQCFINHQDEDVKCRCIEDESHVYSGQFCEVATEKLKLKSRYIIIIGAGGGAAFLVITVVLSVCLCRVRAKIRMKIRENEENNRYRSHSMVDLHSVADSDLRRSRTQTTDDYFDSGLPDTRLYNGREHRVVKENGFGSELYIYSPTSFSRESDKHSIKESRSSRPGSILEYIDTDTKFEIKRPSILEQSHHF